MIKQHKTITIKRSQINFATYNPRKITPKNKQKLRKNLKDVGVMGGIVWNKITGNLVSGHQRVSILDKEYKYENGKNDYDIDVVVVELDLQQEKTQNIALNNAEMQGIFDTDKLKNLMADINFTEDTGFSKQEQINILGIGTMLSQEEYEKITKEVEEFTKRFKSVSKNSSSNENFYIIIVCKNEEMKNNIIDSYNLSLDENRFIKAEDFFESIKEIE